MESRDDAAELESGRSTPDFRPATYWSVPVARLDSGGSVPRDRGAGADHKASGSDPVRGEAFDRNDSWHLPTFRQPHAEDERHLLVLPPLLDDESEIARVTLHSTMRPVFAIRARRIGVGRIGYRVVNEFGSDLRSEPYASELPLTENELIALIDSVRGPNEDDRELAFPEALLTSSFDGDRSYVSVSSAFYPSIASHFYERLCAFEDSEDRAR